MGIAIFVNQINHKYLMNKTKEEIVSLCLWVVENQQRDRKDIDDLLSRVVECLDDENIEGAKTKIKEWDKSHELWTNS